MGFCEFLFKRIRDDEGRCNRTSADECKQYVLDATLRLYGTIDIKNNPFTKFFLVDLA